MKVYEFAKELGLETLRLMDQIRKWGDLKVKSHMSQLSSSTMEEIRSRLKLKSSSKLKKDQGKKTIKKKASSKKVASKKKKKTSSTSKKAIVSPVKSSKPKASLKIKKRTQSKLTSTSSLEKEGIKAQKSKAVIRRVAVHSPEAKANQEKKKKKKEQTDFSSSKLADSVESAPDQELDSIEESSLKTSSSSASSDLLELSSQASVHSESKEEDQETKKSISYKKETPKAPLDSKVFSSKEESKEEVKTEEKKKKLVKETEEQGFLASEFRKREVIFQPKRKKSIVLKMAKKNVITTPSLHKRVIKIYNKIKIKELAGQMGIQVKKLIKKLESEGLEVKDWNDSELDFETAALISSDFGFEVKNLYRSVERMLKESAFGNLKAQARTRPPVVTVMGHVDHGKTTLLDGIRSTNAVQREAGGITQHIGAYCVELDGNKKITFIDTPGHEAFTALRERGAHVTDIVLLVVAANDGVMPQTVEAIRHAQAAKVPIIVVINKVDLPEANKENIKQQLTKYDLVPETWGGNTMYCEVSALKKKGIQALLENIHVLAEIQDLKVNFDRSARGMVIESSQKKGYGYVATVLIKEGTLRKGDCYVAGKKSGRIRSLLTDQKKSVNEMAPGLPVEILGLSSVLEAGDTFDICQNESMAKRIAELRQEEENQKREEEKKKSKAEMSLDDLLSQMKDHQEGIEELSFVLKSDVTGSLEAIEVLLSKLNTEDVKIKVIHAAVGGINESDVLLSSTTGAIVIGFNVRPDLKAQKLAQNKLVEIRTYNVIYKLVDEIKDLIRGKTKPEWVEEFKGRLEVREIFNVSKVGVVIGGFVSEGQISKSNLVRLLREGRVVYEGRISSLKRFKEDVKEVKNNLECGLSIENFNDIKVGDEIEAFIKKEMRKENIFSETGNKL